MGNISSGFNFHQNNPRQTPDQHSEKFNPCQDSGPDRDVSDGGGEGFMIILMLVVIVGFIWLVF
jgi:hypothetical protein